MRFFVDWLDDAANAAPEERTTVCDLRVTVADQNVCLHLDEGDGQMYDHITLPVYSLAEGLVHKWWTIFGARDREYRLIEARMGYASPDLRFLFDGAAFEARADQYSYQNPKIRFWAGITEVMSRSDAEESLRAFIEAVLDRLKSAGLGDTSAKLRWDRVLQSLNDVDERAFCEAAGALGLNPYAISDADTAFLERAENTFSSEPLAEFLSGVESRDTGASALSWIEASEQRPQYRSIVPELFGLARDLTQTVRPAPRERAWSIGYRKARRARASLNLKQGDRFKTLSSLTKLLGNKEFKRAAFVNGVRAVVAEVDERVHVHLRDRVATPEARQSEIFAFARAIGDAICFPGTRRSVVNGLHEAERQAAGRAFAAEFLAPIDEISSMRVDGKDLTAIADDLNVSNEVISRQLENRERIAAACSY